MFSKLVRGFSKSEPKFLQTGCCRAGFQEKKELLLTIGMWNQCSIMKYIVFLLGALVSSSFLSAQEPVIRDAAQYICDTATKQNVKTIALMDVETDKGNGDKSALVYSELLSNLVQCSGIAVVEKQKTDKILEQMEDAQSGLLDDNSVPQMGKLMGAQAMVFSTLTQNTLSVRLVDVATGKILGANISAARGGAKVEHLDEKRAKADFGSHRLLSELRWLAHHRPALFLFAVTNEKELRRFFHNHPRAKDRLERKLSSLPPQRKHRLMELRKKVVHLREADPRFNRVLKKKRRIFMRKLRKRRR